MKKFLLLVLFIISVKTADSQIKEYILPNGDIVFMMNKNTRDILYKMMTGKRRG
jgi:hypothetical protein